MPRLPTSVRRPFPLRTPAGRRAGATLTAVAACAVFSAPVQAQPRVVTFEPPPGTSLAQLRTELFTTYKYGLRLDAGASAWGVGYFGTAYPCPVSTYCASPNGVVSGDETFGTFTFERPSRFFSFFFSGEPTLGGTGAQARVAVQLSRGGVVYTSPFADVRRSSELFILAYSEPVDEVRFVGNPANALFDDIFFAPTAVVPEPSTFALAGTGLLATAGAAAHRKRRAVGATS